MRHELASVRLSGPAPLGAVSSEPEDGRDSQDPARAFDSRRRTAFLMQAPDGEAFVGLRYESPVSIQRLESAYPSPAPPAARRVTRARLEWSDDGEGWHVAGDEMVAAERGFHLLSSESAPHVFWRLLVTRSGKSDYVTVGELAFVTAELHRWERIRAALPAAAAGALLLAGALIAVAWYRERPGLARLGRSLLDAANTRGWPFWALAASTALYYNYFFHLKFRVVPLLQGDSGGYLNNSVTRTPGYGLFLDAFDSLIGNWAYLPTVQLNLLLGSLILLGYAVSRIAGSYLLGMIYLVCALQLELLLGYSAQIVTEASFAAFLGLHVAVMGLLLRRFSRPRAGLAGLLLVLVAATKSIGIVLLAPAALSLLFLRRDRLAAALLLLAPVLAYQLAICGYNQSKYGIFKSSSRGGPALLGHVSWAVEADPGSAYPELSARLEERLRPVFAMRPSSFDSITHYIEHTKDEYGTQLWHTAVPEIRSYLRSQKHLEEAERRQIQAETSRVAGTLAREAILRAPAKYAYHVAAHYYGMWRFSLSRGALAADLARKTAEIRGSVHTLAEGQLDAGRVARALDPGNFEGRRLKPTLPVALFQALAPPIPAAALSAALFALSIVGCALPAFRSRLGPPARGWCLMSLYANAYLGGNALVIYASTRYVAVVQPVLLAMAALAAFSLLTALAGALRRRRGGVAAAATGAPTAQA